MDVSPKAPRYDELARLCDPLFCPVCVGGGISSIAGIRRILAGGADKVAINSAARESPEFINMCAAKFGSQAIVAAIDVPAICGREVIPWAIECEQRGAGEILLTSMDRDGAMEGYDLALIRSVSAAVSIPVIAAGGCGSYADMLAAFQAGAHAVAVGAAFQFKDMTPKGAARYLSEHGVPCRV